MTLTQEEFVAQFIDYPTHDYECLDCDEKWVILPVAELLFCPSCKSENLAYVGIPRIGIELEVPRSHNYDVAKEILKLVKRGARETLKTEFGATDVQIDKWFSMAGVTN
jgi:Zn finger protein HypA/HybF involved in hydrogenase expression